MIDAAGSRSYSPSFSLSEVFGRGGVPSGVFKKSGGEGCRDVSMARRWAV
ncbi:hypothetical protein predicted by Glimmer/Critica [Acetobacter senegalensis]|uniref:Uncharacterized protein n=1 Tax=Acetobacter senegalensis TaxID=446692 RepID=A0A0U5B6T3_9PROT|nr:hypothetical protein predicted by Glimmer/Critica [Acetobacter senegalensis]